VAPPRYRAGIVGLGWIGWLYDVADRPDPSLGPGSDIPGLPPLRVRPGEPVVAPAGHAGQEGLPRTYAKALALDPRTEVVAGCDVNAARRAAFGERYGVPALYEDYRDLLRHERLELLAVCSRAAQRADVVEAAVDAGVRLVLAEKPLCHTLAEADRIVGACERAGVTLTCGTHFASHPAVDRARDLLVDGAIGQIISAEVSPAMHAQNNAWLRLAVAVGGEPEWAVGVAADEVTVQEDREFDGDGIVAFERGLRVLVRRGAPFLRFTGERGELLLGGRGGFRLWLEVDGAGRAARAEVPFPAPNVFEYPSPLYTVDDAIRCHEQGGEPRVGGRLARWAMEIELALRESHRRGDTALELPLPDRTLGMRYAWFR
jgi:predicted dehydrogenase